MRSILGAVSRIPRPSPAMGVALLALLIAASGAAFAAIPSSNGTITACYDKGNGSLEVIDAEDGETCRSTETELSWKDGINGKVANSDKLDGKDSSQFARASLFGSPVSGRNGEAPNSDCVVGEVRLFAGSVTPGGWKMARGQVLQVSDYDETGLPSLLGNKYGGNGDTTFALPDLRGAEPNGAGQAAPYYAICTQGIYPH